MNVLIRAPEGLVLRDGKPFGEEGTVSGGYHDLPLPQTIAGCLRTAVGHSVAADFFCNKNTQFRRNIESILSMGITRQCWVIREGEQWKPVWPLPTDLFFVGEGNAQKSCSPSFSSIPSGGGTDLPFKDWLFPEYGTREKPSRSAPRFLTSEGLAAYMNGEPYQAAHGIHGLITEDAIHVGIDSTTYGSDKGKLFASRTNHMKVRWQNSVVELGLHVAIEGAPESFSKLPNMAYLGGERRTVELESGDFMPDLAKVQVKESNFCKLLLGTPGAFGSWVPTWLTPDSSNSWRSIPGTDIQVRLRSAFVQRYLNVSGWDYETRKPKATRRLVPSGSVYYVELENPASYPDLVQRLHQRSLCMKDNGSPNQDARDGFGLCLVVPTKPTIKHSDISL